MKRAAVLLLGLGACTVGPNYRVPVATLPAAFAAAPATLAPPPQLWWQTLGDRELDRLIAFALRDNLDLKIATTRIAQARAQVAQARGGLFPTIDATAGVNRIDLSKNAGLSSLASSFGGGGGAGGGSSGGQKGASSGIGLPGVGFTTWSLGFDAQWELDIFGGTRREIEGARARVEAAEWDVRDVQLSVAAEVATDYVQLRSYQAQVAIARAEQARQQHMLRLVSARRAVGLASELPVRQQEQQLQNVAANLPNLEAQARARIDALAVLTGTTPDQLLPELTPPWRIAPPPPEVPGVVPSELLRRRADVRAAERRLAAATADIGVAVADRFPKVNLTGMAELLAGSLRTLFSADSLQTSVAGQLVGPLVDGGRRAAVVRARRAQRDEAWFNWRKTILTAVQETEDALSAYTAERRRNIELARGVGQAERAVALAQAQFVAGTSDYQPVLDAQGAVLSDRNALAQSDAAVLADLAQLYKALGGGWGFAPASTEIPAGDATPAKTSAGNEPAAAR